MKEAPFHGAGPMEPRDLDWATESWQVEPEGPDGQRNEENGEGKELNHINIL